MVGEIFKKYFKDFMTDFAKLDRGFWNYDTGVVLLGAQYLYEATGDTFYKDKIIEHMSHYITDNGVIKYMDLEECNLDKINTGKILFFLFRETGEEKYKKAIDSLMTLIHKHPRTSTGNFWHKEIYPYQIWLDGLYMALPFYMDYENEFNAREHYNDIYFQVGNAHKLLYCKEKGLFYHAYDETKTRIWADKETGLSPNFWLRAIGWYLMALIDLYEKSSEEIFEQHRQYGLWFREALQGILPYQDKESGLFYQLVDLPKEEGNYLETSGSAMTAYAIFKGIRLGIIHREKYFHVGVQILEALENRQLKLGEDDKYHLTGTCRGAGLGPNEERDGSVAYYLSEPVVSDNFHGVGAAMMAYAEFLKIAEE